MSDVGPASCRRRSSGCSVEIQRFTQDAQAEVQELQQQLQQEFQGKLEPVLQAVAKEKGLHFIFSRRRRPGVGATPGLDITADVIKRFDAATPAAPKPRLARLALPAGDQELR